MNIEAGKNYPTRDGTRASVWKWSKNMLGQACWVGTVEDGGYTCWDHEGKDLSGTTAWDLVAPKNTQEDDA